MLTLSKNICPQDTSIAVVDVQLSIQPQSSVTSSGCLNCFTTLAFVLTRGPNRSRKWVCLRRTAGKRLSTPGCSQLTQKKVTHRFPIDGPMTLGTENSQLPIGWTEESGRLGIFGVQWSYPPLQQGAKC